MLLSGRSAKVLFLRNAKSWIWRCCYGGADAASYGARGDVAIGASAETNVKLRTLVALLILNMLKIISYW